MLAIRWSPTIAASPRYAVPTGNYASVAETCPPVRCRYARTTSSNTPQPAGTSAHLGDPVVVVFERRRVARVEGGGESDISCARVARQRGCYSPHRRPGFVSMKAAGSDMIRYCTRSTSKCSARDCSRPDTHTDRPLTGRPLCGDF